MSKSVVNCQLWEYDGMPYGYSLHTRSCDMTEFIEEYCQSVNSPDPEMDGFPYPAEEPHFLVMNNELGDAIQASGNGIKYLGRPPR